jgi:uncharacterized membrane protein
MRVGAWLAIFVLVLLGRILHNDNLSAAAEPVALCILWVLAPSGLRAAIGLVLLTVVGILLLGGRDWMLQLLPALIAAFVSWIFARSLLPGRRSLIARAIVAIDGEQQLAEPGTARYATRLTFVWAAFQALLAFVAVLCALHAHAAFDAIALPSPLVFAALLPVAIATLFFGEFVLRRWLLPSAPRHRLIGFLCDIARIWPSLIEK